MPLLQVKEPDRPDQAGTRFSRIIGAEQLAGSYAYDDGENLMAHHTDVVRGDPFEMRGSPLFVTPPFL
jgi:hypothetical protein